MINNLEISLESVTNVSKKQIKKLGATHKSLMDDLENALAANFMAKKYRPFKEKYKYLNDIQTLYTIVDDAHVKAKSKWEYTTEDVSPKTHAIA
jgi:hypothetical protein